VQRSDAYKRELTPRQRHGNDTADGIELTKTKEAVPLPHTRAKPTANETPDTRGAAVGQRRGWARVGADALRERLVVVKARKGQPTNRPPHMPAKVMVSENVGPAQITYPTGPPSTLV